MQLKIGVEGEDDPKMKIQTSTGAGGGMRLRVSGISIRAKMETLYTQAVKLAFMSLDSQEEQLDPLVVENLRLLLEGVGAYLQHDSLKVKVNLQAKVQVKKKPHSEEKDVVLVLKGMQEEGRLRSNGKAPPGLPLEIGLDFNLVTLVDDVTKMVDNGLAW
jgi:hypothetical protein